MLHVLHCWGRTICSMCTKKRHSSLVLYIRFWSQCMQSCIWRPVPTCRSLLHFGKNAETAWCMAMRTVQSTIAVSVFRVCSYKRLKMLGRRWFCMHASGFVSFLLAFCVVCAYFCLAMIFVSFSLALCVVHAMNFS